MRTCLTAFCCVEGDFQEDHANDTCCNYFKSLCAKNETVGWNVSLNAVQDGIWTFFSEKEFNILLKRTDHVFNGDGQWAGQETYSVAATCVISMMGSLVYSRYGINRPFPLANIFATVVSAGAALYAWDRGQVFGQSVFQSIGYSSAQSGYLSGIFAGLFQGPTQFILFKLVNLLASNSEYSRFKQDPKSYLADFFAGVGLSATIGIIPGAVWQLIYNALALSNVNAILAAFAVMTTVLICNYGYAKFLEKLLASECYKDCCFEWCGRDKDFLADDSVMHQSYCTSLCQFFLSPCRTETESVNLGYNNNDSDTASSLVSFRSI